MRRPSLHRIHGAILATALLFLAAGIAEGADPAARCAKAKLAAVGKAARASLLCHARAVAAGAAVEEECLTKARDALANAFARAEQRSGCASAGDAGDLQDDVDLLVTLALVKLAPPAPTPTPGPSPTPTVAPDCANPSHWACCGGYDAPGLGSCSESLVGPTGSQAANNFHTGCTLAGGFSLQGRCPTATCGAAAYCCQTGACQAGTTGWFGDVTEEAVELVCESSTSIDPGACP